MPDSESLNRVVGAEALVLAESPRSNAEGSESFPSDSESNGLGQPTAGPGGVTRRRSGRTPGRAGCSPVAAYYCRSCDEVVKDASTC